MDESTTTLCRQCQHAPVARRGRPYCSQTCATDARRSPRPACAHCGAPTPRPSSRFCAWSCWREWRAANPQPGFWAGKRRPELSDARHPRWQGERVGRSGALRRARKVYPTAQLCGSCHRGKTIRVFRNGDPRDLRPGNVLWRCPECAARWRRGTRWRR